LSNIKISILNNSVGLLIEHLDNGSSYDLDQDEIFSLYKKHKAILFRGFNFDVDGFTTFSNQFIKDFSDYQGGGSRWKSIDREQINNDKTLMTATGSVQNFTIPLHGEMYYMQDPPELLYFYCLIPPKDGGQTTLCDGAKLFNALDDDTKEFFLSNQIKYIRYLPDGDWQKAFMTESFSELEEFCEAKGLIVSLQDDKAVQIEYTCDPVIYDEETQEPVFINNMLYIYFAEISFNQGEVKQHLGDDAKFCPMVIRLADGSPIPYSYIEKVVTATDEITVKVSWNKGDVLMIDNHAVMHGRKKTTDMERKILVRMGNPELKVQL
jgi:alpha-ketoglutarate-dependent taurine dioxygenase